ncbi:hypothetical protein [[Kitasatospora] papulosa]|uniref:hypothetical protein n=1 Tax=[Kitasatospora] papulosa TaxID=1464011 RepID=UPI00363A6392
MNGPEHYQLAEQLLSEAWEMESDPLNNGADTDRRIAAAQVHATLAVAAAHAAPSSSDPWPSLETEPAVAYVYRAEWGAGEIPLGTYTNVKAARKHCEADAVHHNPGYDGRVFDWIGDESEPDAPYELVVGLRDEEKTTDYTVTRIEIPTEYDPEADA